MSFVVIDVETANPNFSSICQVGVVAFQNGKFHDSWESFVNPEDYFDEMNTAMERQRILGKSTNTGGKWCQRREKYFPEKASRFRRRVRFYKFAMVT